MYSSLISQITVNESEEYSDLTRPIKNILTDFVTTYFLGDNQSEIGLVRNVFETFEPLLQDFRALHKLKKADCQLVFKGGNLLRIIDAGMDKQLPDFITHILSVYDKYLRQSDNDFSIMLNPNLEKWQVIYDQLLQLIYIGLEQVRSKFSEDSFRISRLDKCTIDEGYQMLMEMVNETKILPQVYKVYPEQTYDKEIRFAQDDKSINIYKIGVKGSIFPISINDALRFKGGKGSVISFGLGRMKVNFNVGQGELIDVSVGKRDDTTIAKKNTNAKWYKYMRDNFVSIKSKKYDFTYAMGNIDYIVADLYNILFNQREYPWQDTKYAKRVNRLMLFTFYDMLKSGGINKKNLKDILQAFIKGSATSSNNTLQIVYNQIKSYPDSQEKADFLETLRINRLIISLAVRELLIYLGGSDLGKEVYSIDALQGEGIGDWLKKKGKQAFQYIANKYRKAYCGKRSRPLKLGEMHYGCHNWSGPGTVMDKTTLKTPAVNDIDQCSKVHDYAYWNIGKDKKLSKEEKASAIQQADKDAIECYDKYQDQDGYYPSRNLMLGKYGVEQLLSTFKGKPSTFYGGRKLKMRKMKK